MLKKYISMVILKIEYTTEEEVDYAVELLKKSVAKLRDLSPLWDMYKDGVDIKSIKWNTH